MSHGPLPVVALVIIVGFCGFVSGQTSSERRDATEYEPRNSCYAMAVYDELLKAIEMINEQTAKTAASSLSLTPQTASLSLKKFLQDDYDEGGGGGGGALGGFENVPSIVPMIFKVVGSALSLNSSALTESSFGIIPMSLSNRITSVLGTLASSILGPGVVPPKTTRAPPPRRRRTRRTTAVPETTTSNSTKSEAPPSTPEPSTTEAGPTTTDHLFHENVIGNLPVYASAYAPNYVATTNFPIYANSFLHVLYGHTPTTTPVPTTTTPTSTADPNSFNVQLPFDYQEFTTRKFVINVTSSSLPPDYEEYEYEDGATEQVKVMALMAMGGKGKKSAISSSSELSSLSSVPSTSPPESKGAVVGGVIKRKVEDDDDEYKDDPRIKPSLGRISKSVDSI